MAHQMRIWKSSKHPPGFLSRTIQAIITALVIGAGALFPATEAAAEIRTAHLWADQSETESYTPATTYSTLSSSTGIRRIAVGHYQVSLSGFMPASALSAFGAGALGNVQVSAYGAAGNFCQIGSWSVTANILCFDAAGRPANSRFSLLATIAGAGDGVAYAWAGRPGDDAYDAAPAYGIAPAGAIHVTRRGVGHYTVALGGSVAGIGDHVQVSAYGPDPRHCRIAGWIAGIADIRCTDAAGRPSDSAFSILAMNPAAAERRFAYVWANDPDTVNYTPDARYNHAPEFSGALRITRTTVGRYTVPLGARINHAQVSAYGGDTNYCNPVSWTATAVNVACFAAGGAPANTLFTVLGVNRDSAGLRLVDPRPGRGGPLPALPPIPRGPIDPPEPPPPPLFGYADLHVHPASFLGFGGVEDGRQGMMWGRPAVGDPYSSQSARDRFLAGFPETHAENSDDAVQTELRKVIMGTADARTNLAHTPHGANSFETWPNSMLVSHQQIDVDWLRRAHAGGLRTIVAAAVDNEIVDTAYDWTIADLLAIADPLLRGDPIRAALRMPDPRFPYDSARTQLEFIELMVSENSDWMEVALSGADARRIVSDGKLAVILGLELDTLSPAQIRDLVTNHDVRFVTPIHFVDNEVGAAAAYEVMFTLLNGIVGRDGQPYSLIPDNDLDFFINRELGSAQSELNRLTASALGWGAIGEDCLPEGESSLAGDGLRCAGRRNRHGLTDAGIDLVNWLVGRGVFVDLAHMSHNSQSQALGQADAKQCPMVNSHTDVRPDGFDYGATERQMQESLARAMLEQGGMLGLGTGLAEVGAPRRIYYNAGNPLIDLRTRSEWTLDLRQPELHQTIPAGSFVQYRVKLRIGNDELHSANTVTGSLLTRAGVIDECILANSTVGVPRMGWHEVVCTMAFDVPIGDIDGYRIDHNGVGGTSGDNVNIDELVVEANIGRIAAPEWLTLVQRIGGDEGPVYRLKGRVTGASIGDGIFGSHYYVTRLLPRPDDLLRPGEVITAIRMRTFTNEDDLDGAGPAVFTAKLSGHRHPSAGGDLREPFGIGGISNGTFTQSDIVFDSGAETLIADISDRAPILTFGGITLDTGPEADEALFAMINDYRAIASATGLGSEELVAGLAALAPAIAGAAVGTAAGIAGWAMLDPLSAGLVGILIYAGFDSYDNWSTNVSLHALVDTDGRPGGEVVERPLLVGYNPTQRLRRDTTSSTLFKNLPERIEADRPYGGLVVNYKLINDDGDDWIHGDHLEFEVVFNDNVEITRKAGLNTRLKISKDYRLVLPFDRLRRGSELKSFTVRIVGRSSIQFRELDIGLVKDPMQSWMEAFKHIAGLGDFAGQIALGTDLSGFEALTPFSAIRPGPFRASATSSCPPLGGTVSAPCTTPSLDPILFSGRPLGVPYRLNIEDIAGRADPARANPALSVAPELGIALINSTRQLDFRETGLSTIGQLPELAAAAHHADQLSGPGGASLGPELFNSVDALVRAWERLDVAKARGDASGDPESAQCAL